MPNNPLREHVMAQYRRAISVETYKAVRELWKAHSMAEDARNLDGLIATLTPDCVYEFLPDGPRWEGHSGARRFYTEFLGAFPDIQFDLQNIVIGPQGVFQHARATGSWKAPWCGRVPPTAGQRIEKDVLILFPYDAERSLFTGEVVYGGPFDGKKES